ncbi:MAG: hypothetical protein FWG93_04685 [Oscillospiraceae bacterium]|nr:hypothetical protein [Oscillospiraceae bacterium]
MKKVLTGASLTLTGALIFLAVFAAAGNLGVVGGWDSGGRFWAAVAEAKLTFVLGIGIAAMAAGIAVMIWGNLHKSE